MNYSVFFSHISKTLEDWYVNSGELDYGNAIATLKEAYDELLKQSDQSAFQTEVLQRRVEDMKLRWVTDHPVKADLRRHHFLERQRAGFENIGARLNATLTFAAGCIDHGHPEDAIQPLAEIVDALEPFVRALPDTVSEAALKKARRWLAAVKKGRRPSPAGGG